MSTKAGALMEALRKWKTLPEIKKKGIFEKYKKF